MISHCLASIGKAQSFRWEDRASLCPLFNHSAVLTENLPHFPMWIPVLFPYKANMETQLSRQQTTGFHYLIVRRNYSFLSRCSSCWCNKYDMWLYFKAKFQSLKKTKLLCLGPLSSTIIVVHSTGYTCRGRRWFIDDRWVCWSTNIQCIIWCLALSEVKLVNCNSMRTLMTTYDVSDHV